MRRYQIQQLIGNEWECAVFDDGEPVLFDRLSYAVQDLDCHLKAMEVCGMSFDPAEYRIEEVQP